MKDDECGSSGLHYSQPLFVSVGPLMEVVWGLDSLPWIFNWLQQNSGKQTLESRWWPIFYLNFLCKKAVGLASQEIIRLCLIKVPKSNKSWFKSKDSANYLGEFFLLILLSTTTSRVSNSAPATKLAFVTSLYLTSLPESWRGLLSNHQLKPSLELCGPPRCHLWCSQTWRSRWHVLVPFHLDGRTVCSRWRIHLICQVCHW